MTSSKLVRLENIGFNAEIYDVTTNQEIGPLNMIHKVIKTVKLKEVKNK